MNCNNECFASTLSKLKESSYEAVSSNEGLDVLSKYLHVDRTIYERFIKILQETAKSSKSELILLCGSSGDGKSHLLSYCQDNYPDIMSKFKVKNDATESDYVKRPFYDTLKDFIDDFSDENIEKTNSKIIVAINLGTLNNFIENDKENRFTILKKYIKKVGIIEERINVELDYSQTDLIHSINFTDYHMYTLTDDGPNSKYINELINRITNKCDDNPFWKKYKENCYNCHSKKVCPICINYKLLSDDNIRENLMKMLIEIMIKYKIIISTRAVFNFLYNIIVDERYIDIGSPNIKNNIYNISCMDYCNALLPNNLYSRIDASNIFAGLKKIDYLLRRNEGIDNFIISSVNDDNILQNIMKESAENSYIYIKFIDTGFKFNETKEKDLLLKLYIRMNNLSGNLGALKLEDTIYNNYMKYLYYFNTKQQKKLKGLYDLVKNGIVLFNGKIQEKLTVIDYLSFNNKYSICQKIDIKSKLDNFEANVDNEKNIEIFSTNIILKFTTYNNKVFEIIVDYDLFELLNLIEQGYKINTKDKNRNIVFSNFVNNIILEQNKNKEEYIIDKVNYKKYRLNKDDFGYIFEEI